MMKQALEVTNHQSQNRGPGISKARVMGSYTFNTHVTNNINMNKHLINKEMVSGMMPKRVQHETNIPKNIWEIMFLLRQKT